MPTTTIYAIHSPDADKLADVTAEMRRLGAPTVRVVDCGDYYMALEGSHRLAAARALGIEPELVIYDQDDEIDVTGYDWYEPSQWAEARYTAGDVAGELYSVQAAPYSFDGAEG